MKIAPSILAANLIDLKSVLAKLDPQQADLLHMDVMDGHFVPAISFGELYCQAVRKFTSIPLDVHLMVECPEKEVPKYYPLTPHNITFHIEATRFPIRLAEEIRSQGIRAGIALNPGTPASALESVLDHVDLILVMSVEPGFSGQKFIGGTLQKIAQIREKIHDRNILLEVDGGVNEQNLPELASRGANLFVVGSACFKGDNITENLKRLRRAGGTGGR